MPNPGNPNFGTENNPGVLFTSERQPEHNGRPAGVKNRSTIARKVLEMSAIMPEEMLEKLRETFPGIEQRMTTEEIATIAIMGQAIAKGDYNAYKTIMDSAYGAPKQEVATTVTNVNVLNNDPLNDTSNNGA